MKRFLIILAALLLLGGGLYAVSRNRDPKGPKYETVKIDRGSIVAKVTATGTLSALVTVQVGSQVSGRLAWVGVDFNSVVKKGQVIARIDPQLYGAAVEQARANLAAAQGNLARSEAQAEDANRQAERALQLANEKLVSFAERDTAQANAKAAAAQVLASRGSLAQAKAAVNQAQINLDLTTITSPVSGVVISRSVDVGQTVAASLQAPTLFTIAEDLRKMQVDTSVAEADVGKLKDGMPVTFQVDAYPGVKWKGVVRQIRNSPQTVQSVVTYDAVIDVENPELKLKPGMTANVSFVYAEKDDVLRIPNAALRYKHADAPKRERPAANADGGVGADGKTGRRDRDSKPRDENSKTVWVLAATGPESKRIKLGITDGSFTEVLEGIDEGTAVISEAVQSGSGSGPTRSPMGGGMMGPPPAGGGGGRRGGL